MYKLNQKDREDARRLAMKENDAKKARDLAQAEIDCLIANRNLWNFLSEAVGYDLNANDTMWRFDFQTAEVVDHNEESKPLYTEQQISGWKWRPLT